MEIQRSAQVDFRAIAFEALGHGLCVVPPREDGSKAPEGFWKPFQTRRSSPEDLCLWYGSEGPQRRSGIGVICGAVSENLELLEFDAAGKVYQNYKDAAEAIGLGDLVRRIEAGYLERSPSEGVHWLYRCDVISGSCNLAKYESDEIDEKTGKAKIRPLIETKGEGGFVILAPSGGKVHPTGGSYTLVSGGFHSIAFITPEEREALRDLARTFDQTPRPEMEPALPSPKPKVVAPPNWPATLAPWDDFCDRTTWEDLLSGWTRVYTRGDVEYWRRPGKSRGVSATIRGSTGRLYSFTSSTEFEAGKAHSKFDAYACIEHRGNRTDATKALRERGYGTHSRWTDVSGEWQLKVFQNPCPKGERIARPGDKPPNRNSERSNGQHAKDRTNGRPDVVNVDLTIEKAKQFKSGAEVLDDRTFLSECAKLDSLSFARVIAVLRLKPKIGIKDIKQAVAAMRPHESRRFGLDQGTRRREPGADDDLGEELAAGIQIKIANFANFSEHTEWDGNKEITIREPRSIRAVFADLLHLAPGWPKSANGKLFYQGTDFTPVWLKKPSTFFAWLHGLCGVEWASGEKFITKEEFFDFTIIHSNRCDSVELIPHEPQIPGFCYMHPPLPPRDGKLNSLLEFFSPETPVDRELIKAFLLTCFWGGPLGKRPAFMATGPDQDQDQGRGVGKTTLFDIIADHLVGSFFTISVKEDMPDIIKRLLSGDAHGRIGRLDNLKVLRFSWADFEGLLTSKRVNGHAMYVGNMSIPNTLIWTITVNGAGLSKDMAKRTICIKLARPEYKPKWQTEVSEYLSEYRWPIISELVEILKSEPPEIQVQTRWSEWEHSVLAHVGDPAACIARIGSRQDAMDEGNSERHIVADFFEERLIELRHLSPDECCLFIPSRTAAEWLSEALRKHHDTTQATMVIKGLSIPELSFHSQKKKVAGEATRGWVWRGCEAGNARMENVNRPSF